MAVGLFLGPWLFGEDCRIHRKIVLEEAFELPMQEADLSLEAWEVHQEDPRDEDDGHCLRHQSRKVRLYLAGCFAGIDGQPSTFVVRPWPLHELCVPNRLRTAFGVY